VDQPDGRKKLIEHVEPKRRELVSRILDGGVFVSPLITTFSIDGSKVVWIAGQHAADAAGSASE
jgi:hypothetical protein